MRSWLGIITAVFTFIVAGCTKQKPQVYTSDCITDVRISKPTYRHLMDSLKYYKDKFVEVEGTYQQGKNLSAIANDSTFSDKAAKHAFWINFSPDCPLYDRETHKGFFEASDGQFLSLNGNRMVVRGRLQVRKAAGANPYVAILNDIIYVELR